MECWKELLKSRSIVRKSEGQEDENFTLAHAKPVSVSHKQSNILC